MKKLTIYVSFPAEKIALVAQKQKNRATNQEYLGFWSEVQPEQAEKIIDHIATTINYFIDTDKEEIFCGCDEKDLDRILSKVKTEVFDVTVIRCEEQS